MTTTTCQQCLATLPPGAKRCPRCGNHAPPQRDPVIHAEVTPAVDDAPEPGAKSFTPVAIGGIAIAAIAILLAVVYASC